MVSRWVYEPQAMSALVVPAGDVLCAWEVIYSIWLSFLHSKEPFVGRPTHLAGDLRHFERILITIKERLKARERTRPLHTGTVSRKETEARLRESNLSFASMTHRNGSELPLEVPTEVGVCTTPF